MNEKVVVIYCPVDALKPDPRNPRKNDDAVDPVAASIQEYGFRSPIIIDAQNTIINGHTRLKAAKKLGMKEVPCVRVTDLTEEQIRQYRLIDNKTSEFAVWDQDLLQGELMDLDFSGLTFDFDFTDDLKKRSRWGDEKKRCDLQDRVALHRGHGQYYQTLFRTGRTGKTLEEIKTEEHVQMFAETAVDFVIGNFGENLKHASWCIITTPRRRHLEGFHFATAVCRKMADYLDIPFYEDAVGAQNRHRVDTVFEVRQYPTEYNILLYDDIITTGSTVKATRDLFLAEGYSVFTLVSVKN